MWAMSPAPRSPDLLTHIPPRRRRTPPARALRCCLHSAVPRLLISSPPRLASPRPARGGGCSAPCVALQSYVCRRSRPFVRIFNSTPSETVLIRLYFQEGISPSDAEPPLSGF